MRRYSYRVETEEGRRWADLRFRKQQRPDSLPWYIADLVLDREVHLRLGYTVGSSRTDGAWTAIASKPYFDLEVPKGMTLVEGFGTRMDAAEYLLKIHQVIPCPDADPAIGGDR